MNEELMKKAYEMSLINSANNYRDGGPFGAIITDKNGKIISMARNTVILDNDSTAHAEINAIREAEKKLKTHDLSSCILYTSCYPCPMCLSAIIWSNIKEVYYGNSKEDAEKIGFRDNLIYKYFSGANDNIISIKNIGRDYTIKAFDDFENKKNLY